MTRLKWFPIAGAMSLLLASVAIAKPMTLDEAMRDFLANSPFIESQSYRMEEAERTAKSAFGRMLPTLNLNGNYIQRLDDPLLATESEQVKEYGLILRQNLFTGGESYYSWRAARYFSDNTRASVGAFIQELKLELVQAYLTVLTREEILKHQLEQVRVLKNQLSVVKTRFEAGSAILSDVRQAEARLAASEGAAALGRSQREQALANFQRLLGPQQNLQLQWPKLPENLPANADKLFENALSNNPSLTAAKMAIEQEKSQEGVIRSQYLPNVSAEVRVIERDDGFNDRQRQEFVLGMSMNLFNGLQTHHDLARSRLSVRRSLEELEIVKRRLRRDSEEVFSLHVAARSNLSSLELAVKSAEEATRAFQIEYQSGSRSLSDLLNAEEDLLQSRIGLALARIDYYQSAFRIKLVEGSL